MLDRLLKAVYFIGLILGSVVRVQATREYREAHIAGAYEPKADMLFTALPGIGMMVAPLLYVFSSRLSFADYRLPTKAKMGAGIVGTVLHAAGTWLLWRSHVDLGRNWSPKLEIVAEHSLVTEGVFRYMRHPMYAAHLLWALAQPLLLHNWIAGFSFLVTSLPLYLYRIPREERMMIEQFGDEYRAYMQRTGRFLPRK